jgi:23S rRNA pseudouridine1911/1915/1917 synthase
MQSFPADVTTKHAQETATRSTPNYRPQIIEEFPEWLVIHKPAHMAAHPSKPSDKNTLWHHLSHLLAFECVNGGGISIINRLDRETSGLTLVAKCRAAARSLCRQMEAHKIRKTYMALVFGWPQHDCWEVAAPLLRQGTQAHSKIWLKQCIHPAGSEAFTSFETIARFSSKIYQQEHFALVRATPRTGRMHQIRVHLAHSGTPIVGDKIYGPDESCYLEFIETSWTPSLESRLLLDRHALHASGLLLEESAQSWDIPLPPDLQRFLEQVTSLPCLSQKHGP